MEDRHLFRAKKLGEQDWVTGVYVPEYEENGVVDVACIWEKVGSYGTRITFLKHYITMKTLGQCTGFRDKKNKLIFEADIIFRDHSPFVDLEDRETINYIGVVEWVFAGWQYVYKCVNPKLQGVSHGINNIIEYGRVFEVVGNIHDNFKDGVWVR